MSTVVRTSVVVSCSSCWVHNDLGERGQHEVILGLPEQLNHDVVSTTYLQHLDVFRCDLEVPVLPVLADHHHRQL